MNVVDSSGWLEYFADAPHAEQFGTPILDTEHLLVPAISILEVFKRVCQQRDENAALAAVALMHQGTIVDLDGELALAARQAGSRSQAATGRFRHTRIRSPLRRYALDAGCRFQGIGRRALLREALTTNNCGLPPGCWREPACSIP